MERKSKSVAEKVAELILHPDGSSSEEALSDSEEAPKVSTFEEEYELPDQRSTDFRKRNVKLLSEQSARYRGKIVSRKELEEDDAEDSSEDDDLDGESDLVEANSALNTWNTKFSSGYVAGEVEDEEDTHSEQDDGTTNDSDDDEDDGDSNNQSDENGNDPDAEQPEDISKIVSVSNRAGELQKGQSVQNQLRIWEKLLELRIQFQKLLIKANSLPAPEQLQLQLQQQQEPQEEDEAMALQSIQHGCITGTSNLLASLLNLQDALRNQFSELKTKRKRTRSHSEAAHSNELPTKRYAQQLQADFDDFRDCRNAVLLKWDDRTRLLTPGAGAKKQSLAENHDILKKIENALLNRSQLVERSQVPKAGDNTADPQMAAEVNNPRLEQIRNVHIYDDSDFYHQQLRELIEHKANTSASLSEVTRQYVELQKLRQKMKKKVDTRASKGRKLRYAVHNKLINFMAPVDHSEWTDESKNELYKSLFAS